MNQFDISFSDIFIKAENDLLEAGLLVTTDNVFLSTFAGVLRDLCGCDAVELRTIDQKVDYNYYITFDPAVITIQDGKYITDETGVVIPVKQSMAPLEKICRGLFRKPADSETLYHYNVTASYIEDTKPAKGPDLSQTGFGSILVLPFEIYGNSPGMLILYAKRKNFLDLKDVPEYIKLIKVLPIMVRIRRSILAHNERDKELNFLHLVNQVFLEYSDNLNFILQNLVDNIPPAMHYSDRASAYINVADITFQAGTSLPSTNLISSSDTLSDGRVLTIGVYYPETNQTEIPLHFLPDEQNLLNQLVSRVINLLDRMIEKQNIRNLEEQLIRAEKLSTIGILSSGIVHELNNPLANILGYAQLLLKTTKKQADKADLEKIVRSSLQAKETVGKLLFYARQEQINKSRLSLNEVVETSLDLFKNRLDVGKVELHLELDPKLPDLEADSSHIIQVVTNLCSNALQAMPEGGVLKIKTAPEEGKIKLSIADTGVGIPPEHLPRIFEPFYTTKPAREGTGLGLFVVQSIIESYNGSITVQSDPGQGSRFDICLPAYN